MTLSFRGADRRAAAVDSWYSARKHEHCHEHRYHAPPRDLWMLVLFFTGFSFADYMARRAVAVRQGYPLAGALAGLISSTSVTFTFARLSRIEPALPRTLAVGTIAACTMLFPTRPGGDRRTPADQPPHVGRHDGKRHLAIAL